MVGCLLFSVFCPQGLLGRAWGHAAGGKANENISEGHQSPLTGDFGRVEHGFVWLGTDLARRVSP